MSQNNIESLLPNEPFPEHPEIMNFVRDMVRYVLQFRHEPNPPNIDNGTSCFTSNIGEVLLKFINCQYNEHLQNEILRVVTKFRSVPRHSLNSELVEKVCYAFLRQYFRFLQSNTAGDYFKFFVVICKLCLEFSAFEMEDCIHGVVYFTQGMIGVLLDKPCMYEKLDRYAKGILSSYSNADLLLINGFYTF